MKLLCSQPLFSPNPQQILTCIISLQFDLLNLSRVKHPSFCMPITHLFQSSSYNEFFTNALRLTVLNHLSPTTHTHTHTHTHTQSCGFFSIAEIAMRRIWVQILAPIAWLLCPSPRSVAQKTLLRVVSVKIQEKIAHIL